jgi:hypothetical protein
MTTVTREMVRVRVPNEETFGEEPFVEATDLAGLAESLIEQYPDSLGHLADLTVAYLWKKSGGKRGGHGVYGKTAKRSGLVAAFTSADYIVWLAADHIAAAGYDQRQITALLHHELLHTGIEEDEDGNVKTILKGHDFEAFAEEVAV